MAIADDLSSYLASKGIKVYRAAGQEITAHCWWCPDGDPKGRGKLYLNTESWLYDCKRCGTQGNRKTLLEHFGDEDDKHYAKGTDPLIRRRIYAEAVDIAHEMLIGNERASGYLLGRGIPAELILEQKIGYVPRHWSLTESLPSRDDFTFHDLVTAGLVHMREGREVIEEAIVLPYWSHGSVVQLRYKELRGEKLLKSLPGSNARLFNEDSFHGADEVIIVEGEWDSYSLMWALRNSGDRRLEAMGVGGLPGAGSWPDGLAEMLQSFKRVFIGFDPDDTGRKQAAKLKEAVGNPARIVKLPSELPKCDWNDFLRPRTPDNPHGGHDWRDVRDLLIEADLAGKRMFDVGDALTKWRRRQVEAPGLKLGWPSIDSTLRPGLKPGQLLIPLAVTGQGKTVFLSNVAYNNRRVPTLFVSLEMTTEEVFEHLRRIHRFHNPEADLDHLRDDLRLLRIVDQNRIGKGDLADLVREYAEDVGQRPGLVIVDYLQYYARGFRGDAIERAGHAVMELKAVAKEEQVAMIAPSQVSRKGQAGKPLSLDDARDTGEIENTADHLISLFRPDQAHDPVEGEKPETGSVNMQILKSRHGGVGTVHRFRFSYLSLVIVDQLFDKKNLIRVEQENSLHRQGLHYDDYRKQIDAAVAQEALL